MRRKLFTLAAGASAVLCAVVLLWVRSYKSPDRFSGLRDGDRYTLVSAGGRLTLYGPPPAAADPADRRAALAAAAGLRNDQMLWEGWIEDNHYRSVRRMRLAKPRRGTPADRCETEIPAEATVRPLLAALEDPRRFAAAHVLLRRQQMRGQPDPTPFRPRISKYSLPVVVGQEATGTYFYRAGSDDEWGKLHDYDGLTATLRPHGILLERGEAVPDPELYLLAGDYNPAELPTLRDQWHRRLDVVVQSVPYWLLVAVTAVAPLMGAGIAIRRYWPRLWARRRVAANLCQACGYDLRATPDRCRECGAVPARKGAAG